MIRANTTDIVTKANAFASTFAFFPNAQTKTKNAKELASQHTGHH
jgi:hypothetical protein